MNKVNLIFQEITVKTKNRLKAITLKIPDEILIF
jgi:hypothetical protein